MRLTRLILIIAAIAMTAFWGGDADATLGKSKSMGSRGSRTYDRPMERTVTPPPAAPKIAPAPLPAPAMSGGLGFGQRHPFLSGLAGGFIGAGIGSMLFGHPAYADWGASPGAGFLGLLLQLALIGGVIWWVRSLFAGGQTRAGAMPMVRQPQAMPQARPRIAKEFEPGEADKAEFGRILNMTQAAWSNGDVGALRQLATPEVVSFLSDDLTSDASRGVRNQVLDVALQKGDIIESWVEGDREYVTAVLTYAARDFTVRTDTGQVVEGDPNTFGQSTEAWTFSRSRGGRWLLSAVER